MGSCESHKKYDKTPKRNEHPRNTSFEDQENSLQKGNKDSQRKNIQNQNSDAMNNQEPPIISSETIGDNYNINPLEHYEIIELYAENSSGNFYFIKHKTSRLKRFMHEIILKDTDLIDSLKKKYDILRKMDHPKILKIYEVYYFRNKFYVISEYFEEGDLEKILKQKKCLPEKQVANIVYRVLLALQYAHENNIIHGYLNPYHILIDEIVKDGNCDIKVKEFNCIHLSEQTITVNKNDRSFPFFAPEILLNKEIDKSIDIWSLGVMTYLLIEGKLPFEGKNDEEIENNIKKFKNVTFTGDKIKNSTSMAKKFIKKLLVFDPKKRISPFHALNDQWFNHFHIIEKNKVVELSKLEHFMLNMVSNSNILKIQQLCIALIVHNLPQNTQIKELEKVFTSMDTDLNGKLTREELIQGFKNVFKDNSNLDAEKEVDRIFHKIDIDNSGSIGYEEFICACIDKKILLEDQYLKYAFSCFDENNSGVITFEELSNVLTCGGRNEVSKEIIHEIMHKLDNNRNEKINYNEFKKMMQKILE